MAENELKTETAALEADVFPGMFEDEVQATVKVDNKEVTVITSRKDVDIGDVAKPSATGTSGRLKVYLVEASEKGYLIDLPGEALGSTKRLRVNRSQIHKV
jgi:hypothetical protein